VFCGRQRNKLVSNMEPAAPSLLCSLVVLRSPSIAWCLPGVRTSAHNGDIMKSDRRGDGRARFAGVFANKYIDGIPHVVELLDVSASGLQVRRILEPESASMTYPLELSLGGVTLWAWTRRVWRRGNREALRIVSADTVDRARFRKFLRGAMAV
jgi:hypothetical protein